MISPLRPDSSFSFLASTVRPEDDMTTGMEDNIGNLGIEDDVVTTGASEEPHETGGLTTLVSITERGICSIGM